MCIVDFCICVVVSIQVMVSVCDVVEVMCQYYVGVLVVVEKFNGECILVGVVIDCDIVVVVVVIGGNLDKFMLGQIMSWLVVICIEFEGLFVVIFIMCEYGVCCLLVFNVKGGLVGMVSVDDIYGVFGVQMVDLGEVLICEEMCEMWEWF